MGRTVADIMAFVAIWILISSAHAQEPSPFRSQQDKINYGIGVNVIRNFKQQGVDVGLDMVIKGMQDAFSGGKILIGEEELRAVMTSFQNELRRKQALALKRNGDENRKAGNAFLTENSKKAGVIALQSGLQYVILVSADGKKPTEQDKVELRYRGTLIDGTEFDSSSSGGQPTTVLLVKDMVAGCREAVKMMSVGSRWQLFVPPELGYGIRGWGREVGPNATLIYDMELVAVK